MVGKIVQFGADSPAVPGEVATPIIGSTPVPIRPVGVQGEMLSPRIAPPTLPKKIT